MKNKTTNKMEKLTYFEMDESIIVEILNDIVNEGFEDVDDIVDIFYDVTEEFFTFSGMKKNEAIMFNAMLTDIYVKMTLQLKKMTV